MKKYQPAFFLFFFFGINAFGQNSDDKAQSIQNDFQNYTRTESSKNYSGSFLPVFYNRENTVGNRYLFNKWVTGRVVDTGNVIVSNNKFVFNYDKIAANLLATQDRKTIIEVNLDAIRSFTLIDGEEMVTFERNSLINKKDFVVALVESKTGYSLFKSLKTTFHKADYTNNGIFTSGKNYDEFVDEVGYYIIFPQDKEFKKIDLKGKSIKGALANEDNKVKKYFSQNEGNGINEIFLKGLINFLNQ